MAADPHLRVLLISCRGAHHSLQQCSEAEESCAATDFAVLKAFFSQAVGAQVSGRSVHNSHLAVTDAKQRVEKFFNHKSDVPIKVLVFVGDGRAGSGDWILNGGDLCFSKVLDLWEVQQRRLWEEQRRQGSLVVFSDSCYSGHLCAQAADRQARVYVQTSCGESEKDGPRFDKILNKHWSFYIPTFLQSKCGIGQGLRVLSLLLAKKSQESIGKLKGGYLPNKQPFSRCGGPKMEAWGYQTRWAIAVFKDRNMCWPAEGLTLRMLLEEGMEKLREISNDDLKRAIRNVQRYKLLDFDVHEGADDLTRGVAKMHVIVQPVQEPLTGEAVFRLDVDLNEIIRALVPRKKRKPQLSLQDQYMYLDVQSDEQLVAPGPDVKHFFKLMPKNEVPHSEVALPTPEELAPPTPEEFFFQKQIDVEHLMNALYQQYSHSIADDQDQGLFPRTPDAYD